MANIDEHPHECVECGQRKKLLQHERNVHGDRQHECHVCKAKFTRLSHLSRHAVTHTYRRAFKRTSNLLRIFIPVSLSAVNV